MKSRVVETMTPSEIRSVGFDALCDRLGPAGALRFMLQFRIGRGDYTKERRQLFQGDTAHTLARQLRKFSKKFRSRP